MTRVGLDLRIVHYARTGFHRYARGLLRSIVRFPLIDTEYVLLTHPDDEDVARLAPGLARVPVDVPLFSRDERQALAHAVEPLALDVAHFPFSLFPGRIAPRIVLGIHDLTCREWPESIEDAYRPFYLDAIRRAGEADLVTADSATVSRALVACGIPSAKVRTCYPLTPFEDETFETNEPKAAGARRVGQPSVLTVGSLEPRKNLLGLIDAFQRLRASAGPGVRLVVAGSHGWQTEPLFAAIEGSAYREDIHLVRDATDDELLRLLRECTLYVGNSLYEGFGLPVLEALNAGACVVSTPVPSLVEAGFPEAGLVPANDPEALARRLASLLASPEERERLARQGRETVRSFYRACDPKRLARLHGPALMPSR